MKKETVGQTISSMYEEYAKKVSEQRAYTDNIKAEISDCDTRIAKIRSEIDRDITTIAPEKYSKSMDEIESIQRTKGMFEKRLSLYNTDLKVFDNEEEKRQFIIRFKALYKAGEDEFVSECDKHLKALEMLLGMRTEEANKGLALAQNLGEYSLIYVSSVRQIVSQAVNARKNLMA